MKSKGRKIDGKASRETFDKLTEPLFEMVAKEILRQKKRLGGTFAVAHAVATKNSRDLLRSRMGPDLVFIVLNLTKECQRKRLEQRHGSGGGHMVKGLEKVYGLYEPAREGEVNAHNVTVEEGMTKDDVMEKVLEIVKSLS